MVQRLKLLSQADHDAVQAKLETLAAQIADIGNVIGPAFGAAWCDKTLKLHRNILRLKIQVGDRFYEQSKKVGHPAKG